MLKDFIGENYKHGEKFRLRWRWPSSDDFKRNQYEASLPLLVYKALLTPQTGIFMIRKFRFGLPS